MKEYHYTYLLIDPVTGQFYIGSRTCKGVTPQEDVKYKGSMKAWKPEDKKRLVKTILREFPTRKEADLHEGELQKLFINDPLNENYYIQTVGFSTHGLPGPNKKNTQIFINEAFEVHKDKYDYSKVEYSGVNGTVIIICPIHGEFPQSAGGHLSGHGCKKCSGVRDTEMFIEKAKSIHGDKYDYSKVSYVDSITDVIIVCPTHGDFKQRPTNHINVKNGCDKCRLTIKDTTETFIIKAKKIYGDTYNYSKVEYVDSKTDVIIICPKHGEFIKTPANHLNVNQGCTQCGIIEGREKQKESLKNSGKVKGGNNPAARKVINIKTMEVYDCAEEVAKLLNMTGNKLRRMLRGERINRTDFIYQ
jgi:hypothetical protein